jgi:hypothetical protein
MQPDTLTEYTVILTEQNCDLTCSRSRVGSKHLKSSGGYHDHTCLLHEMDVMIEVCVREHAAAKRAGKRGGTYRSSSIRMKQQLQGEGGPIDPPSRTE